jgi:hypothetical protein
MTPPPEVNCIVEKKCPHYPYACMMCKQNPAYENHYEETEDL